MQAAGQPARQFVRQTDSTSERKSDVQKDRRTASQSDRKIRPTENPSDRKSDSLTAKEPALVNAKSVVEGLSQQTPKNFPNLFESEFSYIEFEKADGGSREQARVAEERPHYESEPARSSSSSV